MSVDDQIYSAPEDLYDQGPVLLDEVAAAAYVELWDRLDTVEDGLVARGGVASKLHHAFDKLLHPRGRDGQFIEKGGDVVVHTPNGDKRGKVTNITDKGIEVDVGDGGKPLLAKANDVEQAKKAVATLTPGAPHRTMDAKAMDERVARAERLRARVHPPQENVGGRSMRNAPDNAPPVPNEPNAPATPNTPTARSGDPITEGSHISYQDYAKWPTKTTKRGTVTAIEPNNNTKSGFMLKVKEDDQGGVHGINPDDVIGVKAVTAPKAPKKPKPDAGPPTTEAEALKTLTPHQRDLAAQNKASDFTNTQKTSIPTPAAPPKGGQPAQAAVDSIALHLGSNPKPGDVPVYEHAQQVLMDPNATLADRRGVVEELRGLKSPVTHNGLINNIISIDEGTSSPSPGAFSRPTPGTPPTPQAPNTPAAPDAPAAPNVPSMAWKRDKTSQGAATKGEVVDLPNGDRLQVHEGQGPHDWVARTLHKDNTEGVGQRGFNSKDEAKQWMEQNHEAAPPPKAEDLSPDVAGLEVNMPMAADIQGGTGTKEDPYVTDNVDAAVQLLAQDKYVQLNQQDEVATLLDELKAIADDAKKKGTKAPDYDLCKVSVPGTNLFCHEHKGIPRIKMPQLSGKPKPGSKADLMPKNDKGEVDIGPLFIEHLQSKGINVTPKQVPADHLRASQSQLVGTQVAGMAAAMEAGVLPPGSIFTTRDNYVVDGHHRWAATVGVEYKTGQPMNQDVNEIDMDILSALSEAYAFADDMGIATKSGDVATPPGPLAAPAAV